MAPINKVTHVIFDLDDTLLCTEEINDKMLDELLANHGKIMPGRFSSKFLGTPIKKILKALIEELQLNMTLDELLEEMKAMILKQYREIPLKLMPGAERLVRHLHKHKIPMAIATSSFREEAIVKTTQPHLAEFFTLFNHIVSNDDVKHGKPSPDIYLKAASLFPAKPKDCLVFEDAINGIVAAKKANMQRIWTPQKLAVTKGIMNLTTLTLKSLEFFQPELFGLPAFE